MSIRRIGWGVASQAYSQSVTVLLQLVTTPMLIAVWGPSQFGTWMLVSALPAYLVLLDLGFSQIAANEMSMKMAHADRDGAKHTFASLVGIYLLAVIPVLVLCAVLVLVLPFGRLNPDHSASIESHRLAIILLIAYVAAAILSSVVAAALRAEGLFSTMVTLNATSRLLEGFGIVLFARLFQAGIEGAAVAMLAFRLLMTGGMIVILHAKSTTLRLRISGAEYGEARRLLWPSLMYLGFPLGNAISLQGVLIAIGAFLSPEAVTIYATSRTLARLGVSTLGAINHVFLYEYSVAMRLPRVLLRMGTLHFLTESVGTLLCSGTLWILGEPIYQYWLGGRVPFVREVFLMVIVQSALEIVWAACLTPLVAWNRHAGVAITYCIGASVAILAIVVILATGGTLERSASVLAVLFGVLSIDAILRLRRILHSALLPLSAIGTGQP